MPHDGSDETSSGPAAARNSRTPPDGAAACHACEAECTAVPAPDRPASSRPTCAARTPPPDSAHPASRSAPRKLILAFASHRERPAFANIYFYRHDGIGKGEVIGTVAALAERADSHPSLTSDGAICGYASKRVGGFTPLVNFWHVRENRALEPPSFNNDAGARIEPSLSGDGMLLALGTRGGANSIGGWDIALFDRTESRFVPLPGLNSDHDEREAALSSGGRYLAFTTNRPGGAGLSDIALYDHESQAPGPLDGVNTEHRELNPALSADGRYLAFVSDRPGGAGGKDIYLCDRTAGKLLDLPGLNSVAHEQTPALSPDGRFIAFVSERTSGPGERDIYLYDRELARLVPLPGLNSRQEDFDPAIAYEGTLAQDLVK